MSEGPSRALVSKVRALKGGGLGALGSVASERKMLFFVSFALGVFSLYRAYHFSQTGFLVSDEYGNIEDAKQGIVYGNRFFFYGVNIILFRLLPLYNVNNFVLFLPFYLFLWSGLTVFLFFRIMKNLGFDGRTITLSLFSSLFLIAFLLLSLGFLTEPMGLAMVMLGIYFLVKIGRTKRLLALPAYSALAALTFSAAYYTREPYAIFLMGGVFVVLMIVRDAPNRFQDPSWKRRSVLVASTLLFLLIALFFLTWPVSILTESSNALFGIGETLATPIVTSTTAVTSQILSTTVSTILARTITSMTNTTTVITILGQTITTVISTNVTITIPEQTTTVTFTQFAIQEFHSVLLNSRLFNTLWIFSGGLVLGWNPILLILGTSGFLTLARRPFKKGSDVSFVWVLCLLSLGSYLVVSYLFSNDPTYLSFQHYSTIIRFSDTALPAYFLAAPFAFSVIAKKRKYVISVVAVLLVFTIGGAQVYQGYATSGLGLQANPFALDYRTPYALMRDYFVGHQSEAPFYVMSNDKNPFVLTPGTSVLESVHFLPYLSQQDFVRNRWTTFYIWGSSVDSTVEQAPYLAQFLKPGTQVNQSANLVGQAANATAVGGYKVAVDEVILNGLGFFLVRIQLSWASGG